MSHYRTLTKDDWIRHREIKDHAFYADEGIPTYGSPGDVPDTIAERRGLFVDGELVSVCSLYPFETRLHGEWQALGGIGGVATPPQHRSKGYARELLTGALTELAERGMAYSALWPVSYPYYRTLGWELAHLETNYEFPPEALQGIATTSKGSFDRIHPSEYDRIASVYKEIADDLTLAFDRSPDWWQQRVLAGAWTYCWTPSNGDSPDGYVVYTVETTSDERTVIEIDELIHRTETARQQLLQFIYKHASQADHILWTCAQESRLLSTVTDPDQIDCSIDPGAMIRIVNVEAALKTLTPPSNDATCQLTIQVADPLIDSNNDVFVLSVGEAAVTGQRSSSTDPDVEINIETLSQLFIGTITVDDFLADSETTLEKSQKEALAAVVPSQPVYVTDFF